MNNLTGSELSLKEYSKNHRRNQAFNSRYDPILCITTIDINMSVVHNLFYTTIMQTQNAYEIYSYSGFASSLIVTANGTSYLRTTISE